MFDEDRYFERSDRTLVHDFRGTSLGVHVCEDATPEEIVAAGHDSGVVREILAMLHGLEYKRRQAALVLKLTRKAFGVGWRYPLAASYAAVTSESESKSGSTERRG